MKKIIKIYVIILCAAFSSISCEPEQLNYEEVHEIDIYFFTELGDNGGNQETPPPSKKD